MPVNKQKLFRPVSPLSPTVEKIKHSDFFNEVSAKNYAECAVRFSKLQDAADGTGSETKEVYREPRDLSPKELNEQEKFLHLRFLAPKCSKKEIQILPTDPISCQFKEGKAILAPGFDVYFGSLDKHKFTFYILTIDKKEYLLIKSQADEALLDQFCKFALAKDPDSLHKLGLQGLEGYRFDQIFDLPKDNGVRYPS